MGRRTAYQFSGGNAHVWYPASSPYVLSCGGTKVTVENGRIQTEVVWNDGFVNAGSGLAFWATGGGVSEVHKDVPVWQENAVKGTVSVNTGYGGRGVPDVAANAEKLWNIGSDTAGGTSAATPLWAALVARLNGHLGNGARAGFLNPLLYEAAWEKRGFRRVTRDRTRATQRPRGTRPDIGPGMPAPGSGPRTASSSWRLSSRRARRQERARRRA